jgi:hypothetical protein
MTTASASEVRPAVPLNGLRSDDASARVAVFLGRNWNGYVDYTAMTTMPRRRLVVKTEKDFTRKTSREAMRGLQEFAQSQDFAWSSASCNALEDLAKHAPYGSCVAMESCHSANNSEIKAFA